MDDQFLHDARREPPPEFVAALREKLARGDTAASPTATSAPAARRGAMARPLARALAAVAAVVVVVALLALPGVRAGAQAFLDLFRVRTFTAIQVDPARLARLDNASLDVRSLLGGQVTWQEDPGPPRVYPDLAQAARAAGIVALAPGYLPAGWAADTLAVQGDGRVVVIVDTQKVRSALHVLELDDVMLPRGLDGARVAIHMPPALLMRYTGHGHELLFAQSTSPEIALPRGVELAQLGEIGLRILGLDPAEAHRFAQSIDWHGTVLVPVPSDASSFRDVEVRGHKALLITTAGGGNTHGLQRGLVLVWSEEGRVYGLRGDMEPENLLQLANSIR